MKPVTITPIPIRADLTIKIQGIPHDLTDVEAEKIAAVVRALVYEPIDAIARVRSRNMARN